MASAHTPAADQENPRSLPGGKKKRMYGLAHLEPLSQTFFM
jgi:hypothetical protein